MEEEVVLPDGTILVTRRRYEEEKRLVEELQRRLSELQARWDEAVRGRVVVPPEEYERERAELSRVEAELRAAWSEWGRSAARLRWLYRRRDELRARREELLEQARRARAEGREEDAAALMEEHRRLGRELLRVGGYITDARFALREAVRRAAALRRESARLRGELARKVILTPELRALRAEIDSLQRRVEEESERLSRKVIGNKLIVLHKKWEYKDPKGRPYRNLSVEAVASIVVDSDEPKEKYEDQLKMFLEDTLNETPGFDQLYNTSEDVMGFEEKLVHPDEYPLRGPEFHRLEWWHALYKGAQLKITDFLPGGPLAKEYGARIRGD
jgi:predicted RNase H-like nuclease (RuvC/YqgF family)